MENCCLHYYSLPLNLILLLLLFKFNNITAFTSPTTDELALLAFKNAITSDPLNILTHNWSTHTSFCTWIAVTCTLKHHRVTALNFSRFALAGTIAPHLGNLTFLRSLDLSFNNFTGIIPSHLSNLRRLNHFNAGYNNLTGSIPNPIFNLSSLLKLILTNNQLSNDIPIHICDNTPQLKVISLSTNQLSGPIPPNIWKCRELEVLSLSANHLNGSIPPEIGSLSMLTNLFLGFNQLEGFIPEQFGNLTSLKFMDLRGNYLTGSIPSTMGKLENLQGMYLSNNQLQGRIPHLLCQMISLGELELSANMLTGPIPECFGEVQSLRTIDFGSNKLNSTIPSKIWDLSKLLILNLSSNYLSGNLSTQIGNLKAIYIMDLSSNQFSGDIPSSLDGCQSLETLSLSNNMLTGSIPQSLGSLRGLSRLDLSSNNLSGLMPESLENLRFLEHFNVSYNSLDGEIPSEGPFVNFTAQSFVHNPALCGSSRFQVPPCMKNHGRTRSKSIALLIVYIIALFFSAIIWVIIILVLTRIPLHSGNNRHRTRGDHTSLGVSWRTISYRELMDVTSGFSEENLIGTGGIGSVYKGTLPDGLAIAVKVFNLELQGAAEIFGTETEILSSIRHRNLIRVIGCCANAEFKALVLAYMPNGSLEKWLYSDTYCLDLVQRINIAADVATALEYLHHYHTFPIAHCDIKPSNVLLDQDLAAQVSDFGLAMLFDNGEAMVQTTTLKGTVGYAPPEYGLEGSVSTKGDVYSYGIMLLELFTRKKPTDNMFNGEMGLKEWVCDAIERNAMRRVVDPALLSTLRDQNFLPEEWVGEAIEINSIRVDPALLSTQDQPFLPKVLLSVFYLAIKCLANSPYDRINMIEASFILQKIKYSVESEMTRNSSPYYSIAESPPPVSPTTSSQLSTSGEDQDLNGTS